jgi:hypothetical protein
MSFKNSMTTKTITRIGRNKAPKNIKSKMNVATDSSNRMIPNPIFKRPFKIKIIRIRPTNSSNMEYASFLLSYQRKRGKSLAFH